MILSINFIVKDNFKTKKENNSDVSDTLWKHFQNLKTNFTGI